MSERIVEKQRPVQKVVAASLALLAVGASIKYGPGALEEITSDQSLIVAGVPGQIETWDNRRVWTGKISVTKYSLGVEQCPSDVETAKRDEATQSFNPDLGVRDPACNFDWVKVSGDTLSSVTLGDTITFEGPVGKPLRK